MHRGWKDHWEVPDYTAEGMKAVFERVAEISIAVANWKDHHEK